MLGRLSDGDRRFIDALVERTLSRPEVLAAVRERFPKGRREVSYHADGGDPLLRPARPPINVGFVETEHLSRYRAISAPRSWAAPENLRIPMMSDSDFNRSGQGLMDVAMSSGDRLGVKRQRLLHRPAGFSQVSA